MRLALLLLLALATPTLADQKTETVTAITASTLVAPARPSRTSLFIQNVTGTGPAYCCFTATSCATAAGLLLTTGGGSASFDLNDGINGAVYCISSAASIYVLETWR